MKALFKKLIAHKVAVFISLVVGMVFLLMVFWYWREAGFSKEILKLEVLAPESAKIGDEVEYTVKYKNNGNFTLENPKLTFELPDNSLTEDSKTRLTQNLQDIYPGEENFVKFKGRLLGKEGDLKVARATIAYTPHNLSVRYESNTTFTTKIDSAPITLTYDLPLKVEKGKEITYAINYFSNVDYPLEHLSVKVDSLAGFNIASADPASLDNTEWKLDTLNKGQGGRIKIKGTITADPGSHLNFSAKIGMWRDGVFVVIKEVSQDVEVIQSQLFISQQINGAANYSASPGETLNYQVFFRNIGTTPFNNLFIIDRIEGSALDLTTLRSSDGRVSQNDNLIVFDPKEVSQLQYLAPQQEVSITFSVKLKDNFGVSDSEKNNLIIKNKVDVSDVSQEFDTKVSSKINVSQQVYHATFDGIENSGPIPPEVGKQTTYVVHWQIKNTLNDVKNIKIKALLPQGVALMDNIFPEDQASKFSFDNASREIVWLAGNLTSGSQISLSFQIALTPSAYQAGSLANLIGQATISGEDQATGTVVQGTVSGVTTGLPDDAANSGGGIVQ